MATETVTSNGLTLSYDDGDFNTGTVSIAMDLDMRTGTPIAETGWLSGNSGGSYPGSLAGFNAANADGNAVGSLRLVTVTGTLANADEQTMVITAGCSKILSVIGSTIAVADKTLSAGFTNTGTAAFAKTGGELPAIVLHAEGASVFSVTVMLLN